MIVPPDTKFLVTTQPRYELDAASEIWHCLYMTGYPEDSILVYFIRKKFRAVAGLIAIVFEGSPIEALERIIGYLNQHPWILRYTNRIIPIEIVSDNLNEFVDKITKLANSRIAQNDKWRITVSKHASKIKTRPLIDYIANSIHTGKVSLTEYDWLINIDSLGNTLLGSVIRPYHIVNKKHFQEKIKQTKVLEYFEQR